MQLNWFYDTNDTKHLKNIFFKLDNFPTTLTREPMQIVYVHAHHKQ